MTTYNKILDSATHNSALNLRWTYIIGVKKKKQIGKIQTESLFHFQRYVQLRQFHSLQANSSEILHILSHGLHQTQRADVFMGNGMPNKSWHNVIELVGT